MPGRSRILTWGLPTSGTAAFALGVFLVAQNRPLATAEPPPRAPVSAPVSAPEASAPGDSGSLGARPAAGRAFIGAIGVSEPTGEAIAVAAPRAGVVTRVAVRVGQRVAGGDALFTVDPAAAEREVALAEAARAAAAAEVDSLAAQVPARRAAVAAARAELASARASRDDAANRLRVAESVSDRRAIAAEEVDQRRFALVAGEAQVGLAEARLAEARADLSLLTESADAGEDAAEDVGDASAANGPQLRAMRARAAEAAAQLEKARTELRLHTVRSAQDAVVLQVNVQAGEYAPAAVPDEGLVVLGRPGPGTLRVEIDEVDVPRFNPAAEAWASPRGAPEQRLTLVFDHVEPLLVPKRNLSGRTSELIDTRVLEVIYRLPESFEGSGFGQQFDVYLAQGGPR